ncbi:hypothetical protein [Nocardiopsis ganjiahuensis]|uniref:hypothetical protein n=1 Tax=Nocardiopsis ganjiahuensis TaxID=239984 RepID=UPI001267A459|nr:hypothetical protein [Nocardiopsis ganjiahuensis]
MILRAPEETSGCTDLLDRFSQALPAKNCSNRLGVNVIAPADTLRVGGHGALFIGAVAPRRAWHLIQGERSDREGDLRSVEKVGFFQELPHGDAHGERLESHVSQGEEALKERVAWYLDQGTVVAAATQVLFDMLSEDRAAIGSLAVRTDGIWMWPSDLSYYVREYNVRLPGRFVRHAESSGWSPALPSEERLTEIEGYFLMQP